MNTAPPWLGISWGLRYRERRAVRGAFITLEGTEGVGKSTCLDYVVESLAAADTPGRGHSRTRRPRPLGESIREWILQGDHAALSAETETLLMFAARAYHLDEIIRPALGLRDWVVCDRFSDATAAYQGGGPRPPVRPGSRRSRGCGTR